MQVTINGEARDVAPQSTIAGVLAALGVDARAVAVARNERVVRRADLAREPVRDGDALEIIRAVAGG